MNKKFITIGIGVIILFGLALLIINREPTITPTIPATTNSSDTTEHMTDQQAQPPAPTATNQVAIRNFAFSPPSITVKKGTTVSWTNQDSTQHSVTPDDETAEFKSSPLLAQGQAYQVTFNTIGTFTYHCTPHTDMKATVTVTD